MELKSATSSILASSLALKEGEKFLVVSDPDRRRIEEALLASLRGGLSGTEGGQAVGRGLHSGRRQAERAGTTRNMGRDTRVRERSGRRAAPVLARSLL
jgi:hypothetical protein